MVCVGMHIWLGSADCMIRVVDAASGRVARAWRAHLFPVASLAACDGVVFSLAKNGAIRAWPAAPLTDAHRIAWRVRHACMHALHDGAHPLRTWRVLTAGCFGQLSSVQGPLRGLLQHVLFVMRSHPRL